MPIYKKTLKQSGFTLIELLIVVLLISALSGILLGVINSSGVRGKARDAQRKADLKKIQLALESYRSDFRQYPASTGNTWERVVGGSAIATALAPTYISPIPTDPSPVGSDAGPCVTATNFRYNYRSDNTTYSLTAIMEVTTSNDDSPCTVANTGCGAGFATANVCYIVQNP